MLEGLDTWDTWVVVTALLEALALLNWLVRCWLEALAVRVDWLAVLVVVLLVVPSVLALVVPLLEWRLCLLEWRFLHLVPLVLEWRVVVVRHLGRVPILRVRHLVVLFL